LFEKGILHMFMKEAYTGTSKQDLFAKIRELYPSESCVYHIISNLASAGELDKVYELPTTLGEWDVLSDLLDSVGV
ncbi:MAG: hypothetical protein ACI4VQ_08110, partial [Clostridia bacterium]